MYSKTVIYAPPIQRVTQQNPIALFVQNRYFSACRELARKKPLMRKPSTQLGRSEFVAASRTVTTLFKISIIQSTLPTDPEDDFAFIQKIELNDEEIMSLANSLKVNLPGLSQFHSAFYLIAQTNESDIDFAKRKLSALTPPFIQTDTTHPLNDWHSANRIDVDKCDEALAETAYFFDSENNRLVIRHSPIDATEHDDTIAKKLIRIVTQRILAGLHLDETHIHIEHVIPRIQGGRLSSISDNSRHIVLNMMNNTANKIFDPRVNLYDNVNYISLGV